MYTLVWGSMEHFVYSFFGSTKPMGKKTSKRIVEQEIVAFMGTRTHSVQPVDVLVLTSSGRALERSSKYVPSFLSVDTQYRGYIS